MTRSLSFLQQTIDEVENLIKKHEAFEKAAAAQEERFAALERLTTVSRRLFPEFAFGAFAHPLKSLNLPSAVFRPM